MIVKPSTSLTVPSGSSIAGHQANVRTFERPVQSDRMTQQAVPLDLDGYQIACLPFPTREYESSPQNPGRGQMFLVPLTWTQLIARVRKKRLTPTSHMKAILFSSAKSVLIFWPWRSADRTGQ